MDSTPLLTLISDLYADVLNLRALAEQQAKRIEHLEQDDERQPTR